MNLFGSMEHAFSFTFRLCRGLVRTLNVLYKTATCRYASVSSEKPSKMVCMTCMMNFHAIPLLGSYITV